MSTERSNGSGMQLNSVPFRMEASEALQGAYVELRRYSWPCSIEQTIFAIPDHLVLNLAVTPRPVTTRVDQIAAARSGISRGAGRLIVMMPGMSYRLTAPAGSLRSLHLAIECERLEDIAGAKIDWANMAQFGGEARAGWGVEHHLNRIHEELLGRGVGRLPAMQSCADLVAVEMVRQLHPATLSRPEVYSGGMAAWRLRVIAERVHADGPAPRLAELARLCNLTERQLGRAFKSETGTTIGRYVDEVTMERGHRLLLETSLTLTEIAAALGFANGDSFAQSFRRVTGTAPGLLRKLRARSI